MFIPALLGALGTFGAFWTARLLGAALFRATLLFGGALGGAFRADLI